MKNLSYVSIVLLFVSLTLGNTVQGQKKWNRQTKDGVIGAGAGAIIGAVVDKNNRGVGALIGGAVGGGAGYLYGKHRNKDIIEDRQGPATVHYSGYRTHANIKHENYNNSGYSSRPESYVTSESNSAYRLNDASAMYITNYYTNPAYGFQRKSW